jgi:hypothetical protein
MVCGRMNMTLAQLRQLQAADAKAGKPRRGPKPKPAGDQSEDALQVYVANFLTAALPADCWWKAIPNGGWRAKKTAARLRATGTKPGAHDLEILWGGRLYTIELKVGKNTMSKDQKEVAAKVVASGGVWACCRSVLEVEAALSSWGVPLAATVLANGAFMKKKGSF